MHARRPLALLMGLLLGATAQASRASEPTFKPELKVRWGITPKQTDHLNQWTIGFGANFNFETKHGTFGIEAGYFRKPGDPYLASIGQDPASPLLMIDRARSGDERQNRLEGFALRASFGRKWSEALSWHAGVMLGGTKFRHQYRANVTSVSWSMNAAGSWMDTYDGSPSGRGFSISPYGGVQTRISPTASVEWNLMLLRYEALEYVHVPGSAVSYARETNHNGVAIGGPISSRAGFPMDGLSKATRLIPHLEVAYVFHF